jgi:hypothetical protein
LIFVDGYHEYERMARRKKLMSSSFRPANNAIQMNNACNTVQLQEIPSKGRLCSKSENVTRDLNPVQRLVASFTELLQNLALLNVI